MMKMKSFTVSEVTRYIKRILGTDPLLSHILIEGEISNFVRHSSGHAYFTLKDEQSKLACVMFSQVMETLSFKPKNGDKVLVRGQITVYERDGRYQLNAISMENVGLGVLHIQFEQLKQKLEAKGYFDSRHKKSLPHLPQKIGVITSPTGAAIQDILSVANRRSNFSELLIYPIRVQGDTSKIEICKAIQFFNRREDVDLIILARGGGSIEELWSFNEESVADAIFMSRIPILTGIGHETDFTISDFVADRRAATPSAAAEIAIRSKSEIALELNQAMQKISMSVKRSIESERIKLNQVSPDQLSRRLARKIQSLRQTLNHEQIQLVTVMTAKMKAERDKLSVVGAKLNALSPFAVLQRGYGVISKEGNVIHSIDQVSIDDHVKLWVTDGEIEAKVLSTKKGRPDGSEI